jgi:hypothetical protein
MSEPIRVGPSCPHGDYEEFCPDCTESKHELPQEYKAMLDSLADELERTDPEWVKEVGAALERFHAKMKLKAEASPTNPATPDPAPNPCGDPDCSPPA